MLLKCILQGLYYFISTLVVLGERKNKEKFIATHPIRFNNRCYDLEEENGMYDKSNVLGKGIGNIYF